jgi:probable rRNA maturation factor
VDLEDLTSLAQTTLRAEGISSAELSVSLVTAEEMARLHEQYLGEPGPTDVLAFPMEDAGEGAHPAPAASESEPADQPNLLGDVVICPEYAARSNHDLDAEMRLLLVHGILHLLGFDHEEAEERAEMWARQERYSGVRVGAAGSSDEATA